MEHVERFRAVLRGQSVDRLPRIEWANWWTKTLEAWEEQGLPTTDRYELYRYFGLDDYRQHWVQPRTEEMPQPSQHGVGVLRTVEQYRELKHFMYPDMGEVVEALRPWGEAQERGDALVWLTFEGFFWWPRTLFGIEQHMYAFYDHPELMQEMNRDITDFNMRAFEQISQVCVPGFVTFAEDMSYNHGPMFGKDIFDEFLAPYYRRIIPCLHDKDVMVIVDSDGNVGDMIDWLKEVGVDGVLPLEHQAGVDINTEQAKHPDFGFVGNYDKLVMHKGEQAMREEFERLVPAMKKGRFIPSVDHQTPPAVTLDQYKVYVGLLKEYTQS